MTGKFREEEALNILDALADSVEELGDEEIADEFQRAGRDLNAEAAAMQQALLGFVTDHQKQVLRQEHSKSRERLMNSSFRLPQAPIERRTLLAKTLRDAPPDLTAQFRNLDGISDDEVTEQLMELAALGCLPEEP